MLKTSILALAIALAFSFAAVPAAAKVTAQQKCDAGKQTATAKHAQCRILAEAKSTKKPDPIKLAAALAKCDAKLDDIFGKLEGKFPGGEGEAAEDRCTLYGDLTQVKALNVAVSDAVATGTANSQGPAAVGPDITSDNQSVCELAGGTWESGTCAAKCGNGVIDSAESCDGSEFGGTGCSSLGFYAGTLQCTAGCGFDVSACTLAPPPEPRDCFRDGACGVEGWGYNGQTYASSGCQAAGALASWNKGRNFAQYAEYLAPASNLAELIPISPFMCP